MTIKLEIGDDIEQSFQKYAALFGATKEQYIKEALIEKLEDLQDLYVAKDRLENPSRRYTMQEVEEEIDLEH